MARKKKHEDHQNHEAWAIPYGDLITLLLAFFVVMYSMSSVNEGKYRVLSDSLVAAFQGTPKTITPISFGKATPGKGGDQKVQAVTSTALLKLPDPRPLPTTPSDSAAAAATPSAKIPGLRVGTEGEPPPLIRMAQEVQKAMEALIDKKLVVVRHEQLWLEVEIRTDILFASGVSIISPTATPVLRQLAEILQPFPNPVRVEGHTDNRPINTREFPSNWELSAARAASVVHLFTRSGVDPKRLEIIGLGEHRPIAGNDTVEGRNTNRRVRIVILDNAGVPEEVYTTARPMPDTSGAPQSLGAGAAEPGANRFLPNVGSADLANAAKVQSAPRR